MSMPGGVMLGHVGQAPGFMSPMGFPCAFPAAMQVPGTTMGAQSDSVPSTAGAQTDSNSKKKGAGGPMAHSKGPVSAKQRWMPYKSSGTESGATSAKTSSGVHCTLAGCEGRSAFRDKACLRRHIRSVHPIAVNLKPHASQCDFP